jgi:hypothetical protein
MEPLSIAASALTVLGAVEAAFQSIKAYRDAPSQLEALGNEIVDITAVVTEAGRVITESQNSVHSRADKTLHLTSALTNIRDKARELEVLFRSCVVINSLPSAGHKTSRIKWLKARGKVQSLRNELSNGRLNLLVALANFSASSSLRIELSVQDIFMVANETKEHQQRLEDRLSVERDRDRFAQTQLSEKVLAQVEKLQLHRHSVAHQQTYVQGEPELRDSTPMNTWASEQVQSIVQARKFPAVAIPSPLRSDSLSHISDDWSGMGIRANLGNIPDCSRSCKCSCHLRRRLQTPRLLEGLLGTLFLGYSGSPILSQNCDQSSCRGGKCSSASFTYQFPRWFVQSRMIELQAKITAMYGPELLLRFNRVVDGKALVFHYASTGNVEKMKQLFEQGRASPSDVRIDSGWTPLHYAIQNNQVGICKLLLQAGSDPHMETEAPL